MPSSRVLRRCGAHLNFEAVREILQKAAIRSICVYLRHQRSVFLVSPEEHHASKNP
jgi:hypothetical protein